MPIPTQTEIKSVADAIDQGVALANTNGAPPLPPADDSDGGTTDDNSTDDTSTSDADGIASDDDALSDGTGADDGADTGADADDAAQGDDPAATGADGAADGDAGTTTNADGKPGTKDGKPVADKDPLTAPIPNALKPDTKERIRTLVSRTKDAESKLETATAERNELITAITETGASPEQYAGVLDYLALVNSNDRNKQMQAANFMIRELAALSRVGGFRIPGVTSYAGHKDLEEGVAAGKITQEIAEELAASRAATAHQGKVGAAQAQASEARRRYQEADTAARSEMNTLEAGYIKADPLYKAKKPMIVEMLNEMIRGDKAAGIPPLHPSKWASAYKKIYETLPQTSVWGAARPGAGRTVPVGGKPPQNTPLRTQQPAGATKPEPKSVAEAIEMGIEMARGA
jgi:hypothetical protein